VDCHYWYVIDPRDNHITNIDTDILVLRNAHLTLNTHVASLG